MSATQSFDPKLASLCFSFQCLHWRGLISMKQCVHCLRWWKKNTCIVFDLLSETVPLGPVEEYSGSYCVWQCESKVVACFEPSRALSGSFRRKCAHLCACVSVRERVCLSVHFPLPKVSHFSFCLTQMALAKKLFPESDSAFTLSVAKKRNWFARSQKSMTSPRKGNNFIPVDENSDQRALYKRQVGRSDKS